MLMIARNTKEITDVLYGARALSATECSKNALSFGLGSPTSMQGQQSGGRECNVFAIVFQWTMNPSEVETTGRSRTPGSS